ncbi:MAG: sensor histidine kinase [Planctomycetota bacterium]
MSWLRRIPAETRIVVLVVFVALFQAILLSIFGLKAIQGERRQVAQRISSDAEHFLERSVAGLLVQRLGHFANEALDAAFVDGNPDRLRGQSGLFTDAYLVTASGDIYEPGEKPLPVLRSREAVRGDESAAWAEAAAFRQRYRNLEIPEKEFAGQAVAFARTRPFALDESGSSLSLSFAAAPLYAGEETPSRELLIEAHWIGLLVSRFGFAPPGESAAFLAGVESKLGNDPALADHAARIAMLRALAAERTLFDPDRRAGIHDNVRAGREHLFYVRTSTKEDRSSRVLVVDPGKLSDLLDGVVQSASGEAMAGVTPRIVQEGAEASSDVVFGLNVVPGYVAAATITPELVAAEAREGEEFYRWIIAFSVIGIFAGGFLTARVVMREVKLAKLKSGFVSNVTHELKTPLTSIRMFADMLRAGQVTDPKEQRECLDVIGQETDRLGALIQKVLDFGRSESPRPRFRWVTGSIAPVVQRELERFRRSVDIAELEPEIAVNLPPVVHDPDAFSEVVSNLLSNAYKYSPPDNREIRVTLGPQRGRVVLAVEDNGPGVNPRERRKIFEQFYRADDLLTREVEGTGLGLSIVRNIVRAHGGRIGVEDREGGGSRFYVVLPAAARRAAQPQHATAEPTR